MSWPEIVDYIKTIVDKSTALPLAKWKRAFMFQPFLKEILTKCRTRNYERYADRVRKIVVEHLSVDESKMIEGASFIDDLGADSLDTVELVMAFEEAFNIEIPDDAAEKIQTFGDAKIHQPKKLRLI